MKSQHALVKLDMARVHLNDEVGAGPNSARIYVRSVEERGDTIAAIPRPMKSLSIEEGDSDLVADAPRRLFKIRYAGTDGHLRSASFLVQRRYSWRGYNISPPTTIQANRITLSAYDRDDVVATISIGLDSSSGLFVDALALDGAGADA